MTAQGTEGEGRASFTLTATVPRPFDATVMDVRAALAEQGFGVLTEIDLAWTFKAKLGIDIAPQVILGACRPQLAYEAVQRAPALATVLPCNVVVRELDASSTLVEAFDPSAMVELAGPEVEDVAKDARERLEAALRLLGG